MAAAKYNLKIEQGTTFVRTLTFKQSDIAMNLTGKTYAGKIRESYDSAIVLATFSFDLTDLAAGTLVVSLTAGETSSLPSTLDATPLVYDIEETDVDGITVKRILKGSVSVSPEVTK